jgi:hypothetical protein
MTEEFKNQPYRIEQLFVFIADDGKGEEGVPAFTLPNGLVIPLLGSDQARIDSLRPMAQMIANTSGQKITLYRFTKGEEMEVITPIISEDTTPEFRADQGRDGRDHRAREAG